MLEKIFELIDALIGKTSGLFDKGIFYYIAIVVFVLFILAGVIILILILKPPEVEPEISKEKQDIINHASAYCREKNFNSWWWHNESALQFYCYNETEHKPELDKHFIE